MPADVRRLRLPNGLPIWGFSKPETRILFREVYQAETYARHGIELHDGDTVFDVGANIGLFALWLNERHRGLKMFLFEPLPPVFAALERNILEHMAGADVVLGNFGLADAEGATTFELDPRLTFHSTMKAADMAAAADREARPSAWLAAAVTDAVSLSILPPVTAGLWKRTLRFDRTLAGLFRLAKSLQRSRTRRFTCRLRTLSQVIDEHAVERIDLLKIDVEGAEEDVLAGIAAQDWPKIRQLIVEVHNVANRPQRLLDDFRRRGFIATQQPADLEVPRLMGISTLYAMRR